MRAVNIVILLSILITPSHLLRQDSSEVPTDECDRLSKDLEKALLQDEGNQFRMRKAFFFSPTASPVLLKVMYNVSFGENITAALTSEEPCCYHSFIQNKIANKQHPQPSTNVSNHTMLDIPTGHMLEGAFDCSESFEFKQRNYVYGWTSTGIYVVFSPIILTVMQLQIPLAALRIIHKLHVTQRGPVADTFLWDGSYDLPTLHLNLHISSLACIPTEDLFVSVLEDFNTLVRCNNV